ncbi:FHA domain-containing protein [Gulosibacter sp. GYB002]|uniref:FHA domain-containing protein n=1 Tax=Gulosibacter sp. GYB002 TaxID=2994391 RepID=UPI002F96E08F
MSAQQPPLGISYRPGPGTLIVAAGAQILLSPSLADSGQQLLRGLLSGQSARQLLDEICATDPDASAAAVLVTPEDTSFMLRGKARVVVATGRGSLSELPELPTNPDQLSGWSGGKLLAIHGWRIALEAQDAVDEISDEFVSAGGTSPCSEAWFGEVATFESLPDESLSEVDDDTILDPQPAPQPASQPEPEASSLASEAPEAPAELPELPPLPPLPAQPEPDVSRAFAPPTAPDQPQPPAPAAVSEPDAHYVPGSAAAQIAAAQAAASPAPEPSSNPPRHAAPQPPASEAADDPSFIPRLISNHGHTVPLEYPQVIGRKPSVDRAPEPQNARLIVVPSPNDEISRSHCVVTYEHGSVLVWDLGSANGTRVLRGGSIPEQLSPMVTVPIAHGDIIDLGDGATFWID